MAEGRNDVRAWCHHVWLQQAIDGGPCRRIGTHTSYDSTRMGLVRTAPHILHGIAIRGGPDADDRFEAPWGKDVMSRLSGQRILPSSKASR